MKLYISQDEKKMPLPDLMPCEIVDYDEAEVLLILPGGLGNFHDLLRGVRDKKRIYLFNKESYFSSIIKNIYTRYLEEGKDDYLIENVTIEKDLTKLIEKMEEKENGKINDGKTSKLL